MRSPRGRGGGGFRGGSDGGSGFRGAGGRGGGRFPPHYEGPPSEVVGEDVILFGNMAEVPFFFVHACEGDAVTKLTNEKISYFKAPIYFQNKTQIKKVDEIFGPINESEFIAPCKCKGTAKYVHRECLDQWRL